MGGKLLVLSAAFAACTQLAVPASAGDMFLKLDGVPGYVTAPDGTLGAFSIDSVDFGQTPSAPIGDPAKMTPEQLQAIAPAAGNPKTVSITRSGDMAAGIFGEACEPGKQFDRATIFVSGAKYLLTKVMVEDCVTRGGKDTMTLSFAASKKVPAGKAK